MKIFSFIRKKWLQSKIDNYILEYKDALSKSNSYIRLANDYRESAKDTRRMYGGSEGSGFMNRCKKSEECLVQSEHYKNLANMYRNKILVLAEKCDLAENYATESDYYSFLADLYDDKKESLE